MLDRALGRLIMPEQLLVAAALGSSLLFLVARLYGRPGLGLGYLFFLPVVLIALAKGPRVGAAGGLWAVALYAGSVLSDEPDRIVSFPTMVRLVVFVLVGMTVGYFATTARRLVADNANVLDDLLLLAHRELATAMPSASGFENAVNRRLAGGESFALLIGEIGTAGGGGSDELMLTTAERLVEQGEVDEVARIAPEQFAALASCESAAEAQALSTRLEAALDEDGIPASLAWGLAPEDGASVLELSCAALERLLRAKAGEDAGLQLNASAH